MALQPRSHPSFIILAPVVGLLVGTLTSFGQGWFAYPFGALMNAASPG
jgi:uncharacterized protein DUF6518